MNFLSNQGTNLLLLIGLLIAILGIALVFFGVISWLQTGKKVASRLQEYVAEKKPENPIEGKSRILPRETAGSILNRIFVPGFQRFANMLLRATPQKQLERIDHDLVIAGNPFNLHAGGFLTIQVILFLVGAAIGLLINVNNQPVDILFLALGGGVAIFFLLFPRVWLNGRVRDVKDQIRLNLPDALDMLSVCANAGLGFDQALLKISSYWHTPLGNDLKRVTQEMDMGLTRTQSLRNLSDRLSVDDLSRFISIIIQAEKMGMSYAEVLRSQAVQMRILRQYRAREIANRLPAKMILPLAMLIFPALIAVIIGPIIPTLLDLF